VSGAGRCRCERAGREARPRWTGVGIGALDDAEAGAGESVLRVRALPQVRGRGGVRDLRAPAAGGHGEGPAAERVLDGNSAAVPVPGQLRQCVARGAAQGAEHHPHPQCQLPSRSPSWLSGLISCGLLYSGIGLVCGSRFG
jgi:hypothetical protein